MQRKYILPLFLLIQIVFLQVVSFFPKLIERYYSNGLYVWIAKFSRITFGFFSFSVGDIIYFGVILVLIQWVYGQRKIWRTNWKAIILKIISFLSVFYFLFNLLWALNYHRTPLFEKLNIEKDYSNADLLQFTEDLIAKTNQIHNQIAKNKDLKVAFPYTQEQVFEMNLEGYQSLSKVFPSFEYENASIKKSLISVPLSYMGFGGYLNPFTNEAQVNDKGPMYNFPTTVCHEMAHQLGYASESEANFIGFLASVKNDNLYFQYSGYSYALRYCLHNWQIRDEKMFAILHKKVNPGILKNYDESNAFWKQYETFVETGFQIFYDNFLKFNQQKDGMEGYSKFVNLMVNYYKDKPL
ncbi:MAG: hypothetical protein RL308_1332 [Bacteroidota bacterium]